MSQITSPGHCELCGGFRDLTFHHLIPRKLHRRERIRRNFNATERENGLAVCQPCHRGLHRIYDEITLATYFKTRETILEDPALARHIAWSGRQKLSPAGKK